MNLFESDVRQRRRITAGACHKKRRTRRCTLPSDCLTPAQLRRRNGQVMTYHLDMPMCYRQFMALPQDLRREYLTSLRDGYAMNEQMLGEMLGVSSERAAELMCDCGIRSGVPEKEEMERWMQFCGKERASCVPVMI